MRVKNIEERVARLATLVNGWTKQGSVPRIERDLALDELRRLYDALLDMDGDEIEAEEQVEEVNEEELAEAIGESSSNKTEVYVCHLRQKLEKLTSVKLIRTVRNKGYLMV